MRFQVPQNNLLKDVFEQINFAVALDQLLDGPAEFLVLRGRKVAQ